MNRISLLALTGLFALSACSGGFSPATSAGGARAAATSSFASEPYTMPVTTSPVAQEAERRYKASARAPKYGGGIPGIIGLLDFCDAPKFGAADQVNLAIVEVDAMSAGAAYPLVNYDTAVVINALNFKSSALELGSNTIPAIAYDGLRLTVDPSQSNVVVGGKTYPMVFGTFASSHGHNFTPIGSATSATVDFAMPFDGTAGNVQLIMDFDAFESVFISGNVAQVGPAVHGTMFAKAGVVIGTVVNKSGAPVSNATVQAIAQDGSVAATTATQGDGTFELHGIAGATYSIIVLNTFVTQSGDTVSAQGADSGSPPPITLTVQRGTRLNVGTIKD
jgi:hypothetical protein